LEQRNLLSAAPIDLGVVDYLQLSGQTPTAGEFSYRLEVPGLSRPWETEAVLTVELTGGEFTDETEVAVYQIATSGELEKLASGKTRADYEEAQGGGQYLISVRNAGSSVDLRIASMVYTSDSTPTICIVGTDDADFMEFTMGVPANSDGVPESSHVAVINGIRYEFDANEHSDIFYSAAGGDDRLELTGTDGNDRLDFETTGSSTLISQWSGEFHFDSCESVSARGLDGYDVARLADSEGNDHFEAFPDEDYAKLTLDGNEDHFVRADGFDATVAYGSNGGTDTAVFHDSTGRDTFIGRPSLSRLCGANYRVFTLCFDAVHAISRPGSADLARLYDSEGNDTLDAYSDRRIMTYADGESVVADGFRYVCANATEGADKANLYDVTADGAASHATTFLGKVHNAKMYNAGYGFSNRALGFDEVVAHATGGDDSAVLCDSPEGDRLQADPGQATLSGPGFRNQAVGFRRVYAYSTEDDRDNGELTDSGGDDLFVGTPMKAVLRGDDFYIRAKFFEEVEAQATEGSDVARLYDSPEPEDVFLSPALAKLLGFRNAWRRSAIEFDRMYVTFSPGLDSAFVSGSPGNDTFIATPTSFNMIGESFLAVVKNCSDVNVSGGDGEDALRLYDDPAGFNSLLFWNSVTPGEIHGDVVLPYSLSFNRFERVEATLTPGAGVFVDVHDWEGANDHLEAAEDWIRFSNPDSGAVIRLSGMYWVEVDSSDEGDTKDVADDLQFNLKLNGDRKDVGP
jgi:hypothetical protein